MPDLVTVPNVELARVGDWDASSGGTQVTMAHLRAAVEATHDEGFRAPILKIGHNDPRFTMLDGEPAFGTIRNMRINSERKTLVGDIVGVPAWLAEIMPSAFPSRSLEGFFGRVSRSTGRTYDLSLSALSLLGVTAPAIESLADIAAAYGVAASAGGDEGRPALITTMSTGADQPDRATVGATPERGGQSVDIRELLGLPAEASDEEVQTRVEELRALEDAGEGLDPRDPDTAQNNANSDRNATVAPATPEGTVVAGTDVVTVNNPEGNPPADTGTVTASAGGAGGPGIVTVDAVQFAAMQRDAALGRQAFEHQQATQREAFLSAAIRQGKFPKSRKNHWAALMAADPQGTVSTINGLASGLIPVEEVGYAGEVQASAAEVAYPREWFPSLNTAQTGD